MSGGWSAILLAGQRPGPDPLCIAVRQPLKALIPVAGVPMVARVARMLLACPAIDRVTVIAQQPDALAPALPDDARLGVVQGGAGIATSVLAVAGGPDAPWPVVVTTSDHVLLDCATLTDFLVGAGGCDAAVAVVEQAVVRARFPHNRRTWLRFRGGAWTGANLFALHGPAARPALAAWSDVETRRKKGWRLLLGFGPLLLLRALTRTITLQQAIDAVGRRLGVRARAVPLADARAAVDVDKPSDLDLATAVIEGRA